MARLAGLEPTASSSAGMRSIHLSYKRVSLKPPTSMHGPLSGADYCVTRWCRRRDSNPHALFGHYILNVARLPIPPLRHVLGVRSTPSILAHPSGGRSRGRTSDLLRVKQAL